VTFNLFGLKHTLPLSVWLLIAFAAGIGAGALGVTWMRRKRH